MWTAPVPILDDEDEAELIARFVEYSARYPNETPFAITEYVFRYLRDPAARANQAAMVWSNDLEIRERIRIARDNGGTEPKVLTEEQKMLAKCDAEANNQDNSATVRYKYFELACKMRGLIKENAEAGKGDDKARSFPTFVFAQYPDEHAA